MADSYNVVISRDATLAVQKGVVATSVEEAIKLATEHESEEIFVVGGASIFEQTIARADRLYLTIIDLEIDNPTRFFPEYEDDFHLIKEESGRDNDLNYRFTIWERN